MIVDLIEPTTEQKLAEKLSDPVTFIETLLSWKGKPLKLYPFQKQIARETDFLRDRIVIQKARQIGGSLLVAAMVTFASYVNNDSVFILISKTAEQSGFIASYVRRFFKSSPILAEIIDHKKTNKIDLWLKNGSVVYNRTAGNEGENLRGISCEGKGAIVFDESSYIPDKAIRALLHVAHSAGEIHCSTPRRPKGYFYEICNSTDYKRYKVPASMSPRIPPKEIERMRRLLRPSEFKTDVLAEFAAGENNVFDADSIGKAIDHEAPIFDCNTFDFDGHFPFTANPNRNYIYSLDTAKVGMDSWVLTIGSLEPNNCMNVVAYHAWAGSMHADEDLNITITDNPNSITRDILQYMQRFPCTKFYCDTTSNDYYAHELLYRHLIPVEKVVWSLQKKERMIEHLAICLRAEKLSIPNDLTMVNQLLDYSYDLKRQQDDSDKKIYMRTDGRDDHVSSLAMLAQSITGERTGTNSWIATW